jgi:hypothetical protein
MGPQHTRRFSTPCELANAFGVGDVKTRGLHFKPRSFLQTSFMKGQGLTRTNNIFVISSFDVQVHFKRLVSPSQRFFRLF